MERDRNKMADSIINLTLEILFRLTGENYTVVKKSSSGRCRAPVCEGLERTLRPIPGPPPHSPIHEEMDEQKIRELINKMMELLTGEVPKRCQDTAVYSSMEEWEYIEGHKDQYKDQVMMADQQPLTLPVRSRKRTVPKKCPRPLLPQDDQGEDLNNINGLKIIIKEEETDVSCDEHYKENIPTGKDLIYFNTKEIKEGEETDVSGDVQFEDSPTGNGPDSCTWRSEENLLSSDYKADDDITQDTYEENSIIPDTSSALHSHDLSSPPYIQVLPSHSSRHVKKIKSIRSVEHQKALAGENLFSCSECGKCFAGKANLVKHKRTHTGVKPYSCSECGKCFSRKSNLVQHQRTHTGEKPFSCSDCRKCFTQQSHLVKHQRIHTGDKPFSCAECGKGFVQKSDLVKHRRIHTGEKPFTCSKCGKCFSDISNLAIHKKTHKEG